MNSLYLSSQSPSTRAKSILKRFWQKSHLDMALLIGLVLLALVGLGILYSATNENLGLLGHQLASLVLAFGIMCLFAQISPHRYEDWAPWIYGIGLLMLVAVLGVGVISKGAQRWLNLGLLRFQPSEIMKLAMPMMLSWYLRDKIFPLNTKALLASLLIVIVPVIIIAKQPDLGTALLVAATGIFVILLAGITWKIFAAVLPMVAIVAPVVWHFMHSYQKDRILYFLSPERDPLGSGYNIIQSKIAIGSGGFLGKGWLHGSQVHLQFLPEHSTDFIFAVCGEEFGFVGSALLLGIFIYIVGRGLYISAQAQDTFTRLLAGSLTLTFFTSVFVNIGMATGIVPAVGLPLPLVSYGGSSMVIFLAGFGMIMSVHTHRKLIGR